MDSFVCDKLKEWGLEDWIQTFKDKKVDEEVLCLLRETDVDKLIPEFGPGIKLREGLRQLKSEQSTNQDADVSNQVSPSTSGNGQLRGKRNVDHRGESSTPSPAAKKQRGTSSRETEIRSEVSNIMDDVKNKLSQERGDLITFINNYLSEVDELKTKKRELVGIFGRTGAGKSSLINAVIGQRNFLPSGSVEACTSVMIKVEGNNNNNNYEAEVEFITKEEWKAELCLMIDLIEEPLDRDSVKKLSAVYGTDWKTKTPEGLMHKKYFKEIPEFLGSKPKHLACESAADLSSEVEKYTKRSRAVGQGKDVQRWYWPLVKCVTVKVPNNDLLQHVTLVDLPGSGDRNKSRDQMWRRIVGECSTAWIVSEIKRAVDDNETWDILKSAAGCLGNSGQCQRIHFICTHSDVYGGAARSEYYDKVMERNSYVQGIIKDDVPEENKYRTHIPDDCFEVFTVSSTEFFDKERLTEKDTEIPRLREFLRTLNDCTAETLKYVHGACGTLSLIEGAHRGSAGGEKSEVCAILEGKKSQQLQEVDKSLKKQYSVFEKLLTERTKMSKDAYKQTLGSFLDPAKDGRGFYRTLRCIVNKGGVHTPNNEAQINLNLMLASFLTDVIDEEFQKTFPNVGRSEPFNGAIKNFSLDTEELMKTCKDVKLLLKFLKTKEDIMKTELKEVILDRKKDVYNSLTETIERSMQDCYKSAAEIKGPGTLQNMRRTIEEHVRDPNNTMFDRAKNEMLERLKKLMDDVLTKLDDTMKDAISALKTEQQSIPDVSAELQKVEKLYDELKSNSDMEAP